MAVLVLLAVAIVGGLSGFAGMYFFGERAGNTMATDDSLPPPSWSDDELEQVLLSLDQLEKLLKSQNDMYVYFWDPNCPFCRQADVLLEPIVKNLDNFYMVNVIEEYEAWDLYEIPGTPTLIYFEDGVEKERLVGLQDEDTYRAFLGVDS